LAWMRYTSLQRRWATATQGWTPVCKYKSGIHSGN